MTPSPGYALRTPSVQEAAGLEQLTDAVQSAGLEGEIRLVHEFAEDRGFPIRRVAFSPDGKSLMAGGDAGIYRWDALRWTLAGVRPKDKDFSHRSVLAVHWSQGKRRIAWTGHRWGSILLMDEGDDAISWAGHKTSIYDLAFSPDGSVLASASRDGTILLWSAIEKGQMYRSRRLLKEPLRTPSSTPWALAFGRSDLISGDHQGKITRWDLKTGQPLPGLEGHNKAVTRLTVNSSRTALASGSLDKTVRLWNLEAGEEKWRFRALSPVHAVAFSPNDKWLAFGTADARLVILDASTGKMVLRTEGTEERERGITDLAFSPDVQRLASAHMDGVVKLWDVSALADQAGLESQGRVLLQQVRRFLGSSSPVGWEKLQPLLHQGEAVLRQGDDRALREALKRLLRRHIDRLIDQSEKLLRADEGDASRQLEELKRFLNDHQRSFQALGRSPLLGPEERNLLAGVQFFVQDAIEAEARGLAEDRWGALAQNPPHPKTIQLDRGRAFRITHRHSGRALLFTFESYEPYQGTLTKVGWFRVRMPPGLVAVDGLDVNWQFMNRKPWSENKFLVLRMERHKKSIDQAKFTEVQDKVLIRDYGGRQRLENLLWILRLEDLQDLPADLPVAHFQNLGRLRPDLQIRIPNKEISSQRVTLWIEDPLDLYEDPVLVEPQAGLEQGATFERRFVEAEEAWRAAGLGIPNGEVSRRNALVITEEAFVGEPGWPGIGYHTAKLMNWVAGLEFRVAARSLESAQTLSDFYQVPLDQFVWPEEPGRSYESVLQGEIQRYRDEERNPVVIHTAPLALDVPVIVLPSGVEAWLEAMERIFELVGVSVPPEGLPNHYRAADLATRSFVDWMV